MAVRLHDAGLAPVLASCAGALVAVAIVSVEPAYALDVPPPGTAGDQHVIFDSTFDTNFFARSQDVNLTLAPFGSAGETGFRFRLTGSESWYRFISDPELGTMARGHSLEENLLVGYGIVIPRVSMIALIGPALVQSNDNGVKTKRDGAKAVFSIYARPSDDTMAYGNFFYSTISNAYQAQMKMGVKVPGNFFFGPELQYQGRDHNDQQRLGAHASGIDLGPAQLSLSGGWAHDRQMGSGYYASVNVYASF